MSAVVQQFYEMVAVAYGALREHPVRRLLCANCGRTYQVDPESVKCWRCVCGEVWDGGPNPRPSLKGRENSEGGEINV